MPTHKRRPADKPGWVHDRAHNGTSAAKRPGRLHVRHSSKKQPAATRATSKGRRPGKERAPTNSARSRRAPGGSEPLAAGGLSDIVKSAVSDVNAVRKYAWCKQKKTTFVCASRGDKFFDALSADLLPHVEKFCRGEINKDFSTRYITGKANLLMVGFEGSRMVAFVAAVEEGKTAYIGLICSEHGNGGVTLRAFLDRADDAEIAVKLSALVNVIGLYAKPEFGFSFIRSCDDGPEDIKHIGLAKTRTLSDYSNYQALLEELHSKGFAEPVAEPVGKEVCTRRDLSLADIILHKCYKNGYAMMRCARSQS